MDTALRSRWQRGLNGGQSDAEVRHTGQERRELRRCLEAGHRVELLEGRGERIRKTPHRPRLELVVVGFEVVPVHVLREVLWRGQIVFDERTVDRELRRGIRQLVALP